VPLSADDRVAIAELLALHADGTTGTVTYEDTIVCTGEGWRIRARAVVPRRRPLTRSSRPRYR
jgi:hypothetical protein